MKTVLIALFSILSTCQFVRSQDCAASILLPDSFLIVEDNICTNYWHDTVSLVQDDGTTEFGKFISNCPTWNLDLTLYDEEENCAFGYTNIETALRWGTKITIWNKIKNEITAIVEEGDLEVIKNSIKISTSMNIYGSDGETLIGFSKKSEFYDTSFIVSDINGNTVANSVLTFGESWKGVICKSPRWQVNITAHNSTVPDDIIMWITAIKAAKNMHYNNSRSDGCSSLIYASVALSACCVVGILLLIVIRLSRRISRKGRLRDYDSLVDEYHATPFSTNPLHKN